MKAAGMLGANTTMTPHGPLRKRETDQVDVLKEADDPNTTTEDQHCGSHKVHLTGGSEVRS